MNEQRLAKFLTEVSNWTWDNFWHAERDLDTYTTADGIIFALVRACAMEDLSAIKLAINRVDGKLATPVRVIYPKVYYLFPNASLPPSTSPLPPQLQIVPSATIANAFPDPPHQPHPHIPSEEETQRDQIALPTWGFRETLAKMVDFPRAVPKAILKKAQLVEEACRQVGPMPADPPLVKSVVAAHLIEMGSNRNIDALHEIFEAIDGKLTETIQLVGDDIYLTSYATIAPEGAYLNENGVLQIEATETQKLWIDKLGGQSNE